MGPLAPKDIAHWDDEFLRQQAELISRETDDKAAREKNIAVIKGYADALVADLQWRSWYDIISRYLVLDAPTLGVGTFLTRAAAASATVAVIFIFMLHGVSWWCVPCLIVLAVDLFQECRRQGAEAFPGWGPSVLPRLLRHVFGPPHGPSSPASLIGKIDLRERGIDEAQAADLRHRLSRFTEDWDRPEMSFYDEPPRDCAKS